MGGIIPNSEVARRLRPYAKRLGYMPTRRQLAALGEGSLGRYVCKHGGYRFWAKLIGAPHKPSAVTLGHHWEEREIDYFRKQGREVVRKPTGAPYDLVLDGLRVDVKVSHRRVISLPQDGFRLGYAFSRIKKGRHCDLFDLLCVSGERVHHRFLVPAAEVPVQFVKMPDEALRGEGRLGQYLQRKSALRSRRSTHKRKRKRSC